MSNTDWMDDALCAQIGFGDLWFPEKGGSSKEAKEVCLRCPVQRECREDALERGDSFGIWGATSDRDRRRIVNARRDTPKAA